MQAKPEYRDREDTQVAVLDALADRNGDGMTVFEIRAKVGADIDAIEAALAELKADDLIEVDTQGNETVITVKERVIGLEDPSDGTDLFDQLRKRMPF